VDPLTVEKTIYFTIYAVMTGLWLLAPYVLPTGVYTVGSDAFLYNLLAGAAILIALWVSLFSMAAWAKWACALLTLLGIILLLGGAFWLVSFIKSFAPRFSGYWMGFTEAFTGSIWLAVALTVAWHVWLLVILWRDVQRVRGE
jgi:hypothetical protein